MERDMSHSPSPSGLPSAAVVMSTAASKPAGAQGEFVERVEPVGARGVEELAGLGRGEWPEAPGPVRSSLDVPGDVAGQLVLADGVFEGGLEHGTNRYP